SYTFVPETKENLDWAELITLDLSNYGTPRGKQELAQLLRQELQRLTRAEAVNRQFAIGRVFYEPPLEEWLKYVHQGLDQGQFNGYVPAGRRVYELTCSTFSQTHLLLTALTQGGYQGSHGDLHPDLIQENIEEIEKFGVSFTRKFLDPLHTLLAIVLKLPEDYFRNIHKYEVKSEDHLRYMKYTKYTPEENAPTGNNWIHGHTGTRSLANSDVLVNHVLLANLGSFTLLFRQPIATPQIHDPIHNGWKWVKPEDATLAVNACGAISFLTGGYIRSTIHRIVAPPKDQHVDRLGLLYFSRCAIKPHWSVLHRTSPVLQREGFTQNEFEKSGNPVPTVEGGSHCHSRSLRLAWTVAKQKWQRTDGAREDDHSFRSAQILPGFREQVYA
ncbi:Clavaminate synthase-like protein, partial [Lactifluus subvellereus]